MKFRHDYFLQLLAELETKKIKRTKLQQASGLHYDTLAKIKDRPESTPRAETVAALAAGLTALGLPHQARDFWTFSDDAPQSQATPEPQLA